MRILKKNKLLCMLISFNSNDAQEKYTEECFEKASRAIFKFNMALDDMLLDH